MHGQYVQGIFFSAVIPTNVVCALRVAIYLQTLDVCREGSPPAIMVLSRPFQKSKSSTPALPANCSLQSYVTLLGDENADDGHQKKKLRSEIKRPLTMEGSCGPMMRSIKLQLEKEEMEWHFVSPSAFLHEATKKCPQFGDLVRAVEKVRVGIYMDEVKPGNVLRPDPSRSVSLWYWTLLDLPSWFHGRSNGWFYFASFPTKLVSKLSGGYSYLFGLMLEFFLEKEDPFNFSTGFPCFSTKGMFLCQGTFEVLMCDEKALSQLWNLRGAAGTKPCCLCQNVLGHMPKQNLNGHEWLVHYSCSDRAKFARHTSTLFNDMRERLEGESGNKKQVNKLGQIFGLTFNKEGILWHPTLKRLVCPVGQTMFDWMHILVASGGVAQYEVNEYVKILRQHNVSLERLDAFAQEVVSPQKHFKLPKDFFQERVNNEDNSHIRCFANEVLVAIPVLVLFNQLVLEPTGLLPEHRECLQLMATILDLLKRGQTLLQLLPELTQAIDKHNVLFGRLYPECAKPKYHWLYHIPEGIKRFKVSLSCFSPERKHRAVKTVAGHVCNSNLTHSITMRILHEALEAFDNAAKMCHDTYLDGPLRLLEKGTSIMSLLSRDVVAVHSAKRLMSPTGMTFVRDCVFAAQRKELLFPRAFLQVTFFSGKTTFMAQVDCHVHLRDSLFQGTSYETLVAWEPDFEAVPYSVRSCGSIQTCLQCIDKF